MYIVSASHYIPAHMIMQGPRSPGTVLTDSPARAGTSWLHGTAKKELKAPEFTRTPLPREGGPDSCSTERLPSPQKQSRHRGQRESKLRSAPGRPGDSEIHCRHTEHLHSLNYQPKRALDLPPSLSQLTSHQQKTRYRFIKVRTHTNDIND
ncbi:hypothetical protein JZ751_021201 [Albula glossodonta]|uniref:Uncharacterized protein n=1 Tax=Albula glossodonta TaxID=121402 RepID=A0A8T2NJT3_9TELE|nr:hypothetical protein JZ751_021201 [Albula glossodonta]